MKKMTLVRNMFAVAGGMTISALVILLVLTLTILATVTVFAPVIGLAALVVG